MTVTRVQAVGNDTGNATAASLVVTFAAAVAGNLLLAAANSDATITAAGWATVDSAVSNQGTYLFYKIAVGGETTVTFVPSVTDTVAGGVLEYSGITATPVDVFAHANRASTVGVTALTGTTGVTAQASELVVCVAGPHSYNPALIPTGPSWVTAVNRISRATTFATAAQNSALFVGDYVTTVTGTQSDTCTWTQSSQDAGGIIATFKASAGGAVSGDVSQTTTQTVTAAATNAAVGGAAPTTTVTTTAVGANSTTAASTHTTTTTTTAAATRGTAGAATQTTVATVTATAVAGSVAALTAAFTVVADAVVTAGTRARGSWWQLADIAKEAADMRAYYRDRPPIACPIDGEPLEQGRAGVLHCRFDGWTYPRDYVRPG